MTDRSLNYSIRAADIRMDVIRLKTKSKTADKKTKEIIIEYCGLLIKAASCYDMLSALERTLEKK